MRVPFLCVPLVLLAATMVYAQDTNFAQGPQYLMNGSSQFARPIATPSLSLEGPSLELGADNATGVLVAGGESETVLPPQAVALPKIDLFPIYYGPAPASDVEISFTESSSEAITEIPASILDTGVGQITTAQTLRERGYGVTLGGVAAYEKRHAGHATHVYTNADIDRLRGGS
ncbi:MAG: hypothetical protein ACYDDS_07215 [Candidatus Sulfotelmatobacter sp.]